MGDLISVVIPCFNYGRFLYECVGSLGDQSYENWECIIVDDGSTDETAEVCRRLAAADRRVRFVSQNNSGLSAARNAGLRLATGELIQLLDADDLLEPEKLKVQSTYLERHPHCDIVVGQAGYFGRGRPYRVRPWPRAMWHRAKRAAELDTILAPLVRENLYPVNAALVRRHVFHSVGLFDERLRAHEDWEFWLRCAAEGRSFGFVSERNDRALVRQHEANMSTGRRLLGRRPSEAMRATAIEVRERIHALLPQSLRGESAELLADAKWKFGLELIRVGRMREGWTLYRQGWRDARRKRRVLLGLALLLPGASIALRAKHWISRAIP